MNTLSIRRRSILIAIPILLFFFVSGNGKFDWEKTIASIERFLKRF